MTRLFLMLASILVLFSALVQTPVQNKLAPLETCTTAVVNGQVVTTCYDNPQPCPVKTAGQYCM